MRRPRTGIGAELVPLVLILAGLVGSLALIVSVHRRTVRRQQARPAVAAVVVPAPVPAPIRVAPRPAPVVVAAAPVVEPEPEPELPAAVAEDPTPRVLAKITSAEAEQLLETSRADRKAAALEAARRDAVATSERWRRRESLVHAQLDSLEGKVRRLETEADELALERDALEKERDARKAAVARARSRPGQAILPHKGPNGTWRRPIVVECRDGKAILQPGGLEFGLFELENGFGSVANPFVRAVAREAIRVQGKATPDGAPVVPYIFFVVRPDGIRPYYEARGRLEPLGITFGYELADQDWEIEFPNLDDPATWDGSAALAADDARGRPGGGGGGGGGGSRAEDLDFPPFPPTRRGSTRTSGPGGEFPWPGQSRELAANGGNRPAGPTAIGSPSEGIAEGPPPGYPDAFKPGGSGGTGKGTLAEQPEGGSSLPGKPGDRAPARKWRQVSPAASPGEWAQAGSDTDPPSRPSGDGPKSDATDPGSTFVWPAPSAASAPKDGDRSVRSVADGSNRPPSQGTRPADPLDEANSATPERAKAGGLGSETTQGSGSDRSGKSTSGGGQPVRQVIGPGSAPNGDPPPDAKPAPGSTGLAVGQPAPGGAIPPASADPATAKARKPARPALPERASGMLVDRTFEVVVVCGPRGVIVQPGGYRVTADALKDRDGLFQKQMVGLVKARRAADPRVVIEPKVRFLVQAGGFETYRTARSQFLLSGLDWASTTQVADPDRLTNLPLEGW